MRDLLATVTLRIGGRNGRLKKRGVQMEVKSLPNRRLSTTQVINALKNKSYGDTFTFDELSTYAGLDVREYRSVITGARNYLLKHHGKLLTNLRGVGYRISKPGEFSTVAGSYRNKAGKDKKG
jgi:hypothetical protein